MTFNEIFLRLCDLGLAPELARRCRERRANTEYAQFKIARELLAWTMDGIEGE